MKLTPEQLAGWIHALTCTCDDPEGYHETGSYRVGCPRHTEAAIVAPSWAQEEVIIGEVIEQLYSALGTNVGRQLLRTFYVAEVRSHTPVVGEYDGQRACASQSNELIRCEHHHSTAAAARACARRLGRAQIERADRHREVVDTRQKLWFETAKAGH